MSRVIRCPHCDAGLKIAEKSIGRNVRCPRCGRPVRGAAPASESSASERALNPLILIGVASAIVLVIAIGGLTWWNFAGRASDGDQTVQTTPEVTPPPAVPSEKTAPPAVPSDATAPSPGPSQLAEREWVTFSPTSAIGKLEVLLPGEPQQSEIPVQGTPYKHTVWSVDQGNIVYSVMSQGTSNDGKSRAEHELEIGLKNRNARRLSREEKDVPFVDPAEPHVCFVQKMLIPEWKRFVKLFVDVHGNWVGGMVRVPERSVEERTKFPPAIGFQLVWARSKQAVVLFVEVDKAYYDSHTAAVDANVKKFFNSFDRPDAMRREALDAIRNELRERIESLITLIETGDPLEAKRQLLTPADFEAFQKRSSRDVLLARFKTSEGAELAALLKAILKGRAFKEKVLPEKAEYIVDGKTLRFVKQDDQWYLDD